MYVIATVKKAISCSFNFLEFCILDLGTCLESSMPMYNLLLIKTSGESDICMRRLDINILAAGYYCY